MRTIGLLGGMSWESTALYYQLLNERAAKRMGGLHSAPIVVHSVDFAPIEQMQVDGRWDEAGDILAQAAQGLVRAGAELVALATNTMHKVAAPIERAIEVPFVHLIDATASALATDGLSRVGLLATGFTMEDGFYADRMAEHGIEVLVPGPDDRAEVHRVIYEELCLGIVKDSSRDRYCEVARGLETAGAQGLVLGCTEIELLVHPPDTNLRQYPTTAIHVEAILDAAAA
jgi:aspartate racemase